MEENEIPQMQPQFELIKKQRQDGREYWTSRDLCGAMGYTTYYRFASVIKKAIAAAQEKGMDTNDHFYLTVEMVRLDFRAYRYVEYPFTTNWKNYKKSQLSEKFR